MKRLIDLCISLAGLLIFSPLIFTFSFLVWLNDRKSPLYVAPRVGINRKLFYMIKIRSMSAGADKTGVDSTGDNDNRITMIGKLIRRYKIDEITQLWNVLKGDMSLVGPRPNVIRETDMYTNTELLLLTVKPGITDFASIVFSDEGRILRDKSDPDLAYHQLIRPGKSALGIFYIEHHSIAVDILIVIITFLAIFSRKFALRANLMLLKQLGAPSKILDIASRSKELVPSPPPGATEIVTSR